MKQGEFDFRVFHHRFGFQIESDIVVRRKRTSFLSVEPVTSEISSIQIFNRYASGRYHLPVVSLQMYIGIGDNQKDSPRPSDYFIKIQTVYVSSRRAAVKIVGKRITCHSCHVQRCLHRICAKFRKEIHEEQITVEFHPAMNLLDLACMKKAGQ